MTETPSPLSRRRIVIFVALSIAVSLPAILSGFFNDDFYFDNPLIKYNTPFEYYDFIVKMSDSGSWGWWATQNISIWFFRPLSSLTLYLDFEILGGHPLVAHLHSALWFVLLLIGAFKAMSVILPNRALPWAVAAYSVSMAHVMIIGWIAARHSAVGGAFVMWAAYSYQGRTSLGTRSIGIEKCKEELYWIIEFPLFS